MKASEDTADCQQDHPLNRPVLLAHHNVYVLQFISNWTDVYMVFRLIG